MRSQESFLPFNNAAPGTSAAFYLEGGLYQIDIVCTGTPSATLNRVGPDGSTLIPTSAAITASGGVIAPQYLPPGIYKAVIATSTANYLSVTRIPIE